ncbi:DUF5367 family protein [Flagellimonas allohymeniacidonis]|uniref:DUF5367 domain-containing protein n=1 Tax=Flagellimonas allohymeniacidonis TaxID=2517819 RepID=A0A4Q8QHL1_9FLAO|nr:DUF5367 family protein [Allomuricauda hymeniacidonis]TAI48133.1 hypothetical protein EW142_15930 [Allomuricauda hymeniacidonis]
MKRARVILIGAVIWILGVSFYSLSFFVNIMEDAQQQANLVLFVTVMPLVWLGSKLYYKKDHSTHGYRIGQTFFLVAAALDALITVPFMIIPNGGSYYEFFTDIGFWIIGLEFITTATLYWYARVYTRTQKIS